MTSENSVPVIRHGTDVCGNRSQFSCPLQNVNRDWPLVTHQDTEGSFIQITYENGRSEEYVKARVYNEPCSPHYVSASSRLKTFKEWPKDAAISPEKLVEAGFYSLSQGDMVRCFYCDLGLQQWSPKDDAWVEHAKHQPECFFINLVKGEDFVQECTSRLHTGEEVSEPSTRRITQFSHQTHDEDQNWPLISHQDPERGFLRLAFKDGRSEEYIRAKIFRGPLNQQYASPSARMKTFKEWPENAAISPEKLVEAGFYSLSQSDMVRCFYCDLGLQQWCSKDNAWVEHAKHQPECFFVNLVKGEDFVQRCASRSSDVDSPANQTHEPEEKEQVPQQSSPSPSEPSAEQRPRSSSENSATEVSIEGTHSGVQITPSTEVTGRSQQGSSSESSESCPLSNLPRYSVSLAESTSSPPSSKSTVNSLSFSNPKCLICLEEDVRVFFYPCAHAVTCLDCSMAVTHCILCRKRITTMFKIHL
ncbi:baculoviral IAP repeat-containing protein 7-B-like [Brevipalpus obovatus]|uniref:baculoviral IAP repeat-containing protein 7-B-like n=1 Tax=Brevipalpus obovatus TaxID=246614 RepID=UPI003D9F221F